MLLSLVATRFAKRTQKPPPTFALIGLGLLAGAAGAVLTAGVAWEWIPASVDVLGRRLLSEGMVMLLVLGVGGFLGPRLLGSAPVPQHVLSVLLSSAVASSIAGITILASLVAEYGFDLGWTAYLRAAVISTVLISALRLWRPPANRTTLSWTIWIGNWVIATGVWVLPGPWCPSTSPAITRSSAPPSGERSRATD